MTLLATCFVSMVDNANSARDNLVRIREMACKHRQRFHRYRSLKRIKHPECTVVVRWAIQDCNAKSNSSCVGKMEAVPTRVLMGRNV